MLRTSLGVALLTSFSAFAQSGDEWNAFPPAGPSPQPAADQSPPAAVEPARPRPSEPRAPAVVPAGADAGPGALPPPATASRPTIASDGAADAGAWVSVTREERLLPGTEPTSPSTLGLRWDAPENARVTVGQVGLGTLYVPSARMGRAGLVRVSFLGDALSLGDFPVRGAQTIRSAVTFAASYQPFSWAEAYVAYAASAATSNRTSPALIQSLGDLTFGAKAGYEVLPGLHTGLDLRLFTLAGVGNQGADHVAVGFKPAVLATYDARRLSKYVPVLATVAMGATLDSSAGLVSGKLSASEEFALGVNRYPRFDFGAALEVPLPIVAPFLEYGFALPLGVAMLTGPDGTAVAPTDAMRQNLAIGLKSTVVKDLTLLFAVDIGLARFVGLGVPATPPWRVCFGASFAIDTLQRGEVKIVETVRERRSGSGTALEGVITDAETKAPLAGAVVTVEGVRPSASSAVGEYRTLDLQGDQVTMHIARDGYASEERVVVLDRGQSKRLDLALTPDRRSTFKVTATCGKKPTKATVTFAGADPTPRTLETPETASEPVATDLPAGHYVITASAEGCLSQTREVQVSAGATLPVDFELVSAPKKSLVVFKGDKIDVLQQVHFAPGKSDILADSYNLLQQVADSVIKNGVKRLRVEGHTDNRGDRAANQALSEARARAVADFLVAQGFEKQRVESVGFGDTHPIAPNLTARGRELNRRVDFIVVER